jgi:hypothetical protein
VAAPTTSPAVSVTIRHSEFKPSATTHTRVNDHGIRQALEAAGVEFIDADNGGPGVRPWASPPLK